MLRLGKSAHGIPGRKNNGFLGKYIENILGEILLFKNDLVNVLTEPRVGHHQITIGAIGGT